MNSAGTVATLSNAPKVDPATRVLPGPGLYRNVPEAHYHGWRGVCSSSELRILAEKSPAHVLVGRGEGGETSDAKAFGSMVHDLVFRPLMFPELYIVRPEGSANSNAFKAKVAALQAERPFVQFAKPADIERAKAIKKVLMAHPLASPALFDGDGTEVSIVALDSEWAVTMKARLDTYDKALGFVDLKVTTDVSEDAVARKIGDFRYDLQAAFHMRVASESGGLAGVPPEFAFVFVEDHPPHDVQVYQVPGPVLTAAESRLDDLVPLWAKCEKLGEWPGSPAIVKALPLPWKLRQYAERGVV